MIRNTIDNGSSATESDIEPETTPAAKRRKKKRRRTPQTKCGTSTDNRIDAAAMHVQADIAIASLQNINNALSMTAQHDGDVCLEVRRSLLAKLVPLVKEIRAAPGKEKAPRKRRTAWLEAAVRRGVQQEDSGSWTVDKLRTQIRDSLAQLKLEGRVPKEKPFVRAFSMMPLNGYAVHYLGKNVENKSKELVTPGWVLHNVSSATVRKDDVLKTQAVAMAAFAAAQVDTDFAAAHTSAFGTSLLAKNVYLGALYLDIPRNAAETTAVDQSPWRIKSEPNGWVIRRAICFFKNAPGATCNPGLPYTMRSHIGADGILQAILMRLAPEHPKYFFTI